MILCSGRTVGRAYRARAVRSFPLLRRDDPPDKPHIYELHVYALDKMLDLERGFLLNELYREMDGHILAQHTLKGIYEN